MKYSVVCGFEVCSCWHRTGFPSLWPVGKNSNNTDELEKRDWDRGVVRKVNDIKIEHFHSFQRLVIYNSMHFCCGMFIVFHFPFFFFSFRCVIVCDLHLRTDLTLLYLINRP